MIEFTDRFRSRQITGSAEINAGNHPVKWRPGQQIGCAVGKNAEAAALEEVTDPTGDVKDVIQHPWGFAYHA